MLFAVARRALYHGCQDSWLPAHGKNRCANGDEYSGHCSTWKQRVLRSTLQWLHAAPLQREVAPPFKEQHAIAADGAAQQFACFHVPQWLLRSYQSANSLVHGLHWHIASELPCMPSRAQGVRTSQVQHDRFAYLLLLPPYCSLC